MTINIDQNKYTPYAVGAMLPLLFKQTSSAPAIQIAARIVHIFPMTMSAVLVVELQQSKRVIIKMYDRRTAFTLRKTMTKDTAIYTDDSREKDYKSFVETGFADTLNTLTYAGTVGEDEVFMHRACMNLYKSELMAYERLKKLQGSAIPIMYGAVTLRIGESATAHSQRYFDVQGLMMEYVEGFNLLDASVYVQIEDVHKLIKESSRVLALIGDLGVHNRDPHPSHIIVRQSKPVLIDFAISKLRDELESDEEWYYKTRNAEGTLEKVMAGILAKDYDDERSSHPSSELFCSSISIT